MLAQVVPYRWHIHEIDVNNIFLNGDLQEDVYMQQSQGFEFHNKDLICKLHKVIYKLKQDPMSWF